MYKRQEGYLTYKRRIPQVTNPNQKTTLQVLTPPGTEYKDIYDTSKIHSVGDYTISYDNGETFHKPFEYPTSIDSKRLVMGNCITLEDTNGNRKLWKKRYSEKIDAVAAMMDAFVAYKNNREAFE